MIKDTQSSIQSFKWESLTSYFFHFTKLSLFNNGLDSYKHWAFSRDSPGQIVGLSLQLFFTLIEESNILYTRLTDSIKAKLLTDSDGLGPVSGA